MFEQPQDFREESEALYVLLAREPEEVFERKTLFKDWTVTEVLRHLHVWNIAADLSLVDPDGFRAFHDAVKTSITGAAGLRPFEREWLKGLSGPELLETWRQTFQETAEHFAAADPKARVEWAGPSMSVRSSITARLMETWAHGQEIYDMLGVVRENKDRIRNIVVLGLNTYGWTFKNRGETPPEPVPYVELRAPSGETWRFGEPNETERVIGSAEGFCQVVTQTRNIADTDLEVTGPNATRWMSIAQCFAGPPETPPAAGVRKTAGQRRAG